MSVDWESPTWGQHGHNVHEDSHGSWTHAERGEEQ